MDGPGLGAGTSLGRAGAGWGWIMSRRARDRLRALRRTCLRRGGRLGETGSGGRRQVPAGPSSGSRRRRKWLKGSKRQSCVSPELVPGVGDDMVRGRPPIRRHWEVKTPSARIGEQVTLMV